MEINVSIAVVFIVHSCIYIYIYHVVISWRLYYINGGLMMEY